MRKPKSSASSKSSPLSTPTSRPLTPAELNNLKIIRSYGVKDLEKYIEKIKKNILVFKTAIAKEKAEMVRVKGMIQVLKNDIKTAERLTQTGQ